MIRSRALVLGTAIWAVGAAPEAVVAQDEPSERPSNLRVIKTFDFFEPENHEPVPMHWDRLSKFGFPDFARGGFDESAGCESAPSFRLDALGTNVAFTYHGRDIPVKPGSDYEIHVRVRTSGMNHARAYVSAFYADRYGRMLADSETFSGLVGGDDGDHDWQQVSITLVGEYPSARIIGLTLWVTQDSVWSRGPVSPRRIEHVDVDAVAWFDDVVVHRLPRTAIRTADGTPLFTLGEPVRLDVLVSDPDGLNATAELAIADSEGRPVWRRALRIRTEANAGPERVSVGPLDVGVYTANLNISTNGRVLVSNAFCFAVISRLADEGRPFPGRLGIVLDEAPRGRWLANLGMLQELAVQHAKIPVRGDDWSTPAATTQDETFDELLGWMARNRMQVVAELRSPTFLTTPREQRILRPLLDILSEEPEAWLPYVSYLLSRYADMVTSWQVGQDGDAGAVWDDRVPALLQRVRSEFASFVFDPVLVTTWSLEHQLQPARTFGDALCIRVPSSISPTWIDEYWASLPLEHAARYWAFVEPLPAGAYTRRTRLADFAERLVALLKLDVSVIYVRQPWIWEPLNDQPRPVEELLVLRAVAAMLSDARWAGTMRLDAHTIAEVFDRGERGVLVVQDKTMSDQPRVVESYLGDDVRVYDVLGRELPVEKSDGRVRLHVGAEPLFVTGVPTWQMRLRGGVGLDEPRIDTAPGIQTRKIQFTNVADVPIGGVMHLTVPRYWEVKPVYLPFNLQPGESFERELRIRVPNNESAGDKTLLARMALETGGRGTFDIPIAIELGMRDVDVTTFAMTRGSSVVVRQIVTNRSDAPLSFSGFVAAPGRPRISRVIPNIQPGQTLAKDYTLPGGEDLAGQSIRVGLREVRGDRQYSQSVIVP